MIALARHGETAYNAAARFQGQLPVPLNARGREQAVELASNALKAGPWAALWCSSLARARETAAIVGAEIELTARVDAGLNETDAGRWTDRLFADIAATEPEAFARYQAGDPGFAFPGGESFDAQRTRVMAAIERIRSGPKPALVVCHRGVIRLVLTTVTGDLSYRNAEIANGSLTELP